MYVWFRKIKAVGDLNILLPGSDRQVALLLKHAEVNGKSVLLVGSGSVQIALMLREAGAEMVEVIVEDYESFINSSLLLGEHSDLPVKIMDFAHTDYPGDSFDIVYAQGALSSGHRREIVKEIKRLLKPGGLLCSGEIIKLESDVPAYVEDIFAGSGLDPLTITDLKKYYTERKFNITFERDLSGTLKEYYSSSLNSLETATADLSDNEKSYYKKLIKQIKHEATSYLQLGADKYIGFFMLIMEWK
jgi:SAM-dependent methyltransferase